MKYNWQEYDSPKFDIQQSRFSILEISEKNQKALPMVIHGRAGKGLLKALFPLVPTTAAETDAHQAETGEEGGGWFGDGFVIQVDK